MRTRILTAIMSVLALALVAFALPLGFAVQNVLVSRALGAFESEVQQIAVLFDAQELDERPAGCVELQFQVERLASSGAGAALVTPQGRIFYAGGSASRVLLGEEFATALTGRPEAVRRDGQLAAAAPMATRPCGRALVLHVTRDDDAVTDAVAAGWFRIGAVGLAVLALGVAAALWTGRRLAQPFERVAESAKRLGDGDFTSRAPRSDIEEADAIAAALDTTARRLATVLGRGAAFAADASHQLRTPLTALRLQIESLAASGADPADVEAALAETDRLEATIDELVALTTPQAAEEEVALRDVVAARVETWQRRADEAGRRLIIEDVPAPPVRVRPEAVGQALHVLLDNALRHGEGDVLVRTEPGTDGTTARIVVEDEGPGPSADVVEGPGGGDRGGLTGMRHEVPLSGGRGLILARSLLAAEGGRLVTESTEHGGRIAIVIPAAPTEGALT